MSIKAYNPYESLMTTQNGEGNKTVTQTTYCSTLFEDTIYECILMCRIQCTCDFAYAN